MGFFDRIRKGKLFFGKKMPSVVVEFTFRGRKYILEEFDMEFKQDVNDRNQPDSDTYGGLITITISDRPDEWINGWIMNTHEERDGEFRFLINDAKIEEGAALNIVFKDACCINYQKIMNPLGAGVLTTLVISPRIVMVGNEEFKNNWKN